MLFDFESLARSAHRRCSHARDGWYLAQARNTLDELIEFRAKLDGLIFDIGKVIQEGEAKISAGSGIDNLHVTETLRNWLSKSGYVTVEQIEEEIISGDLSIFFSHAPSYLARTKIAIQQYRSEESERRLADRIESGGEQ